LASSSDESLSNGSSNNKNPKSNNEFTNNNTTDNDQTSSPLTQFSNVIPYNTIDPTTTTNINDMIYINGQLKRISYKIDFREYQLISIKNIGKFEVDDTLVAQVQLLHQMVKCNIADYHYKKYD
jgi:hypothetical protein